MDFDDIDYMTNSELLYKLSGQLVEHLRSYLKGEDQIFGVLYANQKAFAGIIRGQMLQHFQQPEVGFDMKVTRTSRSSQRVLHPLTPDPSWLTSARL